jgi:hypothetical protein
MAPLISDHISKWPQNYMAYIWPYIWYGMIWYHTIFFHLEGSALSGTPQADSQSLAAPQSVEWICVGY